MSHTPPLRRARGATHASRQDSAAKRPTQVEKLYDLLSDFAWHSTRECVREVGHCFAVAKHLLVGYGYAVERRPHPTKRRQFQYRLRSTPPDDLPVH